LQGIQGHIKIVEVMEGLPVGLMSVAALKEEASIFVSACVHATSRIETETAGASA